LIVRIAEAAPYRLRGALDLDFLGEVASWSGRVTVAYSWGQTTSQCRRYFGNRDETVADVFNESGVS
jgi:hypothetical protein